MIPFVGGPLVEAEHHQLTILPWHDQQVLVVLSASRTEVRGGPQRSLPGARNAVAVDVDADGARELVTCGANGIRIYGWEAERPSVVLSDPPCTAIAATAAVLMAGGTAWTLPGPFARGPPVPGAEPRLASDGVELWIAPTGRTVSRIGPAGTQVFSAPGDIDALIPGGWTVRGDLYGPEGRVPAFDGVGALATGDVDGDGGRDWLVAHPAAGLVGVVSDGPERAVPVSLTPVHLVAGDLDGDGVDEVVIGDGRRIQVLGRAPTNVAPAPEPALPEDPPHGPWTRVLGLRVLDFAGSDGTLASGRMPARAQVSIAVGLAMGSPLAPSTGLGGSPSFALAIERRVPVGGYWWGFDATPLLLQRGDSVVWPIVMGSSGMTFGGPHVRAGPFVTAGLVGAGAGWRAVLAPFESERGTLRGFEARVTLLLGPAAVDGTLLWDAPTGTVSLMYVDTAQVGWRRGRLGPTEPSPPQPEARTGLLICRQASLLVGAAGGPSSTRFSWEHIGVDTVVEPSYSVALGAGCETGSRSSGLYAGLETAPWFSYRIPWDRGASDQVVHQMGSATFGIVTGSGGIRVGPIVTAGIWILGAGGRVVLAPIRGRGGIRHGLELRAEILYPSAPSAEGMLLYSAGFDPRRRIRVIDER